MKWLKISITTITEAEDIIISSLYDIGLEGAQIEDKIPLSPLEKEQMFVDILPEIEEDDGIAVLNFFVEKKKADEVELNGNVISVDELCDIVRNELEDIRGYMDIGDGEIKIGETEDIDWINNWKQYFHKFYVDDLLIIPSWEEVDESDKDKMLLRIDPGTAFGTGMHETTQLCIRQLQKHVKKGDKLLDVGTGSGILAILSLMLGADNAIGTDLDNCTIDAVKDNMDKNNIANEKFKLMIGNVISDLQMQEEIGYECYDIVTANILADVLIPLAPVAYRHVKPEGVFITSGIIDDKEDEVKTALSGAGFHILETCHQGEWVSVTAQRPQLV